MPGDVRYDNNYRIEKLYLHGFRMYGLIEHSPTTTVSVTSTSTEFSVGASVAFTGTKISPEISLGLSTGTSITSPNLVVYDESDQTEYIVTYKYVTDCTEAYYTYFFRQGYTFIDYDKIVMLTIRAKFTDGTNSVGFTFALCIELPE